MQQSKQSTGKEAVTLTFTCLHSNHVPEEYSYNASTADITR